jgi:ATP-binding cassette subfamily C protein CydD
MAVLKIAFLSAAVLEFFSSISIALVAMYLGMNYLGYLEFGSWSAALTLESGFFILLIAPDFYLPLRELGTHYHARAEALGAAREILDILSAEAQQDVSGEARPLSPRHTLRICCEDLHLAYDTERRPAVRGVSFELNTGERVVLVGATGAGKTSVVNLLLGFMQPDKGRITINGTPLTRITPESWRRNIAWIGQNPVLLHGTILENIRMGKPEASTADIEAAARSAGVLAFTAKLPDGLATRVGEHGYGLSRGQAQRVALARTFIKAAPLLVLDEPTAGLDTDTAARIMAAIWDLSNGRTVLWLTHRLRGLERADRILAMTDGRIVQAGTWSELHQVEGELRRLLTRQQEDRQHG